MPSRVCLCGPRGSRRVLSWSSRLWRTPGMCQASHRALPSLTSRPRAAACWSWSDFRPHCSLLPKSPLPFGVPHVHSSCPSTPSLQSMLTMQCCMVCSRSTVLGVKPPFHSVMAGHPLPTGGTLMTAQQLSQAKQQLPKLASSKRHCRAVL